MGVRHFLALVVILSAALNVRTEWTTNPPFYGQHYTGIAAARGLVLDSVGDILAVSAGPSTVDAIFENQNGQVQRVTIVNGSGLRLNHGVAVHGGYLYASSPTNVYRWAYVDGQRTVILTPPQTVIAGIPSGGHDTRTMAFDAQGRLYVSVGSNANVDQNSDRARIRRFTLTDPLPGAGIQFSTGEVFADGLRNEVGLAFDASGVLWGVENGADNLNRPDIGGDIHNGNPAEEFNKFDRPAGTHYGYPYCFSTHTLPGYSAGTQFAWPSFMNDGVHTDAWCRNPANNNPPALAMAAHMAPLGVTFYDGKGCGENEGAFPCEWTGDAFVAFHGSWNSDVRVGYRVSRFPIDKTTNLPTGEEMYVIYEPDVGCNNCFRPVNAIFDLKGHLIVSSYFNNALFRVYYGTPPPPVSSSA